MPIQLAYKTSFDVYFDNQTEAEMQEAEYQVSIFLKENMTTPHDDFNDEYAVGILLGINKEKKKQLDELIAHYHKCKKKYDSECKKSLT